MSPITSMQPFLEQLKNTADAACDAAYKDESCYKDAINWGNFGCVEARFYITDDGNSGFSVFLQEAAPDCVDVQLFVSEYLEQRGFPDVEVVTEW